MGLFVVGLEEEAVVVLLTVEAAVVGLLAVILVEEAEVVGLLALLLAVEATVWLLNQEGHDL